MTTAETPAPAPNAMTLVIPLRAKEGMTVADFYEYWLNAHVTLPPRSRASAASGCTPCRSTELWPTVPGVSTGRNRARSSMASRRRPSARSATSASSRRPRGCRWRTGSTSCPRCSPTPASANTRQSATRPTRAGRPRRPGATPAVPAPSPGHAGRGFPAPRRRDARPWPGGLTQVLKLRRHLFEPLDVTLDHPGVRMTKPLDRQYQAALEVVVKDEAAWPTSPPRRPGADAEPRWSLRRGAPRRVDRCITTKYDGTITLAGVRGVAVADVIPRLGAESQRDPEVSPLFLPAPVPAPA